MQITVTLSNERIRLPIASAETIQGLIYRALRTDEVYSTRLHEEGKQYSGRAFKHFSFSEPKGKYEIDGREIVFLSHLTLAVRSADPYLIQLLFTYFTTNKQVRLGDNTVRVTDLKLGDRRIFADRIEVRTLSPITVYMTDDDGHTVYFSPEEERFYAAVMSNARRKWASYTGSEEGFSLRIRPVEGASFVKRSTRFKSTFITAWHGRFILEGAPQVLDFLYQTGLGSKNSQGFGLFDMV